MSCIVNCIVCRGRAIGAVRAARIHHEFSADFDSAAAVVYDATMADSGWLTTDGGWRMRPANKV